MPDRHTGLLFPELDHAAEPKPAGPPDARARAQALDLRSSFVVEAPAGSGKTGLLIQRYLKLLADDSVTQPEQVLGITFTNKAAGEMRDRVFGQLERALQRTEPAGEFERTTRDLAQAVLARDEQLGWKLLDRPHRLNLRTIDSVCAQIARGLPVLSGSGGALRPLEDAEPLYREAARRTLLLLGDPAEPELNTALGEILLHRDGDVRNCEELLAGMLRLREQWGMLVPLERERLSDAELDREVRPRLQRALEQELCAELTPIERMFPAHLLAEVSDLAGHLGHAAPYNGGPSPLAPCAGQHGSLEAVAEDRDRWVAVAHLLLTKGGEWRRPQGLTGRNLQLDYDRRHSHHTRLCEILDALSLRDDLRAELCRVSDLPLARYPENQWVLARHLFRLLRRALVELQLVFAERGACDFAEGSLLARAALKGNLGGEDLAMAMGSELQHLLVDEMQDTSSGQYELLQLLTHSWDGHSQTVFLVGDPRQSIYLFRQARVEHFLRTVRTERLGDLPLRHLQLTANFRSQRTLVEQFNDEFHAIFEPRPEDRGDALPYRAADPVLPPTAETDGVRWHAAAVALPDKGQTEAEEDPVRPAHLRQAQWRRNARSILQIARRWIDRPLPAGRGDPWRMAVLVRNRNHLVELISALRKLDAKSERIPFRATDIEPLGERQEILDLKALTRAVLHPGDRAAGLALLRAPWCGLTLAELHALTGADDPAFGRWPVLRLMEERGHLLNPQACRRMQRVWTVWQAALGQRGRLSLAHCVERAWRSLGGDAPLRESERTNARRYFELLEGIETETGAAPDLNELARRLQRLYAEPEPVPEGSPFLELLTIHGAKGLEWDVVMIPALERGPGRPAMRLLTWAELNPGAGTEGEASPMMLAPISARGEEVDLLTRWLKRRYGDQESAERRRLFYVAATRAREELHLFASPDRIEGRPVRLAPESLLNAAWPAAAPHFAALDEAVSKPAETAAHGVFKLAAAADIHIMPGRDAQSATEASAPAVADENADKGPLRPRISRFPESFDPATRIASARERRVGYSAPPEKTMEGAAQWLRPEGSLAARAIGNTVHALLELAASEAARGTTLTLLAGQAASWMPRVTALLRAEGLAPAEVERAARESLAHVRRVLSDPRGQWLLQPGAGAAAEYALIAQDAVTAGLSAIRVDRLFPGGGEPGASGDAYLWVVDYKTASHGRGGKAAFLEEQKTVYAPQLERYARVLADSRGIDLSSIRLGLYYTAFPELVWWAAGAASV